MTNAQFYLEDLKSKFRKINTNEYYLSYSGGKDSHLLYWFIKEYAPEFKDIKVVGINTYMEHEQIRKRIYDNCDIVLLPTLKPFEIKAKYGIPCFSKLQDDFIYRYQNGSRAESIMNRLYCKNKDGSHSFFGVSKKARELLLSDKLHKVSPKCCTFLKKQPAREFEKQSKLKPILRSKRWRKQIKKSTIYKLLYKRQKIYSVMGLNRRTRRTNIQRV